MKQTTCLFGRRSRVKKIIDVGWIDEEEASLNRGVNDEHIKPKKKKTNSFTFIYWIDRENVCEI